jgi:hypothetical protein
MWSEIESGREKWENEVRPIMQFFGLNSPSPSFCRMSILKLKYASRRLHLPKSIHPPYPHSLCPPPHQIAISNS